jgi:hypothetical protein
MFCKSIICAVVILLLAVPFSCSNKLTHKYHESVIPYIDFLQSTKTNSIDYIIGLFQKYDIVIVCERAHPEITQYDFILELISDRRFIREVGNIFTEIGAANYANELNEYLTAENLSNNEKATRLNKIYRNFYDRGIWEKTNLYSFLKRIYELNQKLTSNNKINLFPSGIEFNWDHLTPEEYRKHYAIPRDSAMATNIIDSFNELSTENTGAKALIIMNFRHSFNQDLTFPNGEIVRNVGRFLFDAFPGRVANIMINTPISIAKGDSAHFKCIQDGRWDAAFKAIGNRSAGFDFNNSPFGENRFDLLHFYEHNLKYKDVFTGFIFYKPPDEHICRFGITEIFDSTYKETLKSRLLNILEIDSIYVEEYLPYIKGTHDYTYESFGSHPDLRISISTIHDDISQWLIQ